MPNKLPELTTDLLKLAAKDFATSESNTKDSRLYGVTDGKAIGTHVEAKFKQYLHKNYRLDNGNSAKGIDLPSINVDIKVTSLNQPQSSCPFKDAKQKIYGLGYSLIIFVYEKSDDTNERTSTLNFKHVIFVESTETADFQITAGLIDLIERKANKDDIIAFLEDRMLPIDETGRHQLADEIMKNPPRQGYLTISNALQWRLQYGRVIEKAGFNGIVRII